MAVLPSSACAAGHAEADAGYSSDDAQRGAQLRVEASIIMPIIFDPCGSSPAMDPTIARYETFTQNLSLPRQRLDIVIAKADYDYQMSLVDIQCLPGDAPQVLERENLSIAVAGSVLDRMEALAAPQSERED